MSWLASQGARVSRVVGVVRELKRASGGSAGLLLRGTRVLRRDGPFELFRLVLRWAAVAGDYSSWVKAHGRVTPEAEARMRECIAGFERTPLVSIVMPTYNSRTDWLLGAVESLQRQAYTNWQLCIADDASTEPRVRSLLERLARDDPRINVVFREQNGHISAASNSALELCRGDWIALMDHDDVLPADALFQVVAAINAHPEVAMLYSDEDKIDEKGRRFDPHFKPDWNIDLFYSYNLVCHLAVYRAQLVRDAGGFTVGMEGAQDYDLALRIVERISPSQIHHIPRVLYHWRAHGESTAREQGAKPYAIHAGERALNAHFHRRGLPARAEVDGQGYRVRYPLPTPAPLVSILIPTRNQVELLRQCVESVRAKSTYPNYELIVIDNGSDDADTLAYLATLRSTPSCRVLRDDRPFNYSQLNNSAVEQCAGEIVALLNNDIEVITPDWLEEMVSLACQPGVGAVGARLWYPDDTLQHGGVVVGLGGVAGHSHKRLPRGHGGHAARVRFRCGYSAVTAACLVVSKQVFQQVGGLNENELKIAFNDVDFCLRIREAGYRNVWTPYADLYHHESATRGVEDTEAKQARFASEAAYMRLRWAGVIAADPAYNPNLTLDKEDFSFAWPPRAGALGEAWPP
jgi:O-antigen biosynthesis protein